MKNLIGYMFEGYKDPRKSSVGQDRHKSFELAYKD